MTRQRDWGEPLNNELDLLYQEVSHTTFKNFFSLVSSNATATTLTVQDASMFRANQWVAVTKGATTDYTYITGISGNVLTVATMTHWAQFTAASPAAIVVVTAPTFSDASDYLTDQNLVHYTSLKDRLERGLTPATHLGSGGSAHAVATTQAAGFMSAADKQLLASLDAGGGAAYEKVGNKGAANGYAPLDANQKVPEENLPPSYVGVQSVNNKSGIVNLSAADVGALTQAAADARYLGTSANATSASKLLTARTISLTGDVTGSVSFDGSGNVSISTTDAALATHRGSGDHDGRYYTETESDARFLGVNANAASASKLAAARTISLTGDVTGSVNFDGSGNVSLSATGVKASQLTTARTISLAGDASGSVSFNGSGDVSLSATINKIDGQGFTNSAQGNAVAAPNDLTENGHAYVSGLGGASLFGQGDGGIYAQAHSANWVHQIFGDYRTGQMAVRGKNNGTWTGWRVVLDDSNYGNYAPTKTGGGASGDWGINVTGSAAKLTTARTISLTGSVTGSVSFDGSGNASISTTTNHSHNTLVGMPDTRNTATTPGTYGQGLTPNFKQNGTVGISGGSYAAVFGVGVWSDDSGGGNHELAFSDSGGEMYHRYGTRAAGWGTWGKIWNSRNFDPSTKLNMTGGTLTGGLGINASGNSYLTMNAPLANETGITFGKAGTQAFWLYVGATDNRYLRLYSAAKSDMCYWDKDTGIFYPKYGIEMLGGDLLLFRNPSNDLHAVSRGWAVSQMKTIDPNYQVRVGHLLSNEDVIPTLTSGTRPIVRFSGLRLASNYTAKMIKIRIGTVRTYAEYWYIVYPGATSTLGLIYTTCNMYYTDIPLGWRADSANGVIEFFGNYTSSPGEYVVYAEIMLSNGDDRLTTTVAINPPSASTSGTINWNDAAITPKYVGCNLYGDYATIGKGIVLNPVKDASCPPIEAWYNGTQIGNMVFYGSPLNTKGRFDLCLSDGAGSMPSRMTFWGEGYAQFNSNLTLGGGTPDSTVPLLVYGPNNIPALKLSSASAGWGSGMQFVNTAAGGRTWGIYSGSDGLMHISNVGASSDAISIDQYNTVAINGAIKEYTTKLTDKYVSTGGHGSSTLKGCYSATGTQTGTVSFSGVWGTNDNWFYVGTIVSSSTTQVFSVTLNSASSTSASFYKNWLPTNGNAGGGAGESIWVHGYMTDNG